MPQSPSESNHIDSNNHADPAQGPLASKLLAPDTFAPLVADGKTLVIAQIKKKGMAVRTAVSVVQKIKPDIVDRTVRELLPGFVRELEPCYAEYRASDTNDFRAYLVAQDARVADAALSVADRRAESIQNRTIGAAYQRVRGRAEREVKAAVPDIAALIAGYAPG